MGLTLNSYLGWRASSIYSVPISCIHQGPLEHRCPSIEFGTSVFKVSPIYPVGWLASGGLLALFKAVVQFSVHRW